VPFYLRKSFSLGPLRINLSKSGLGASAGVTGLRVGAGPKGKYLHAGRGGLYYRKSLNEPKEAEELEDMETSDAGETSRRKDGLVRWLKVLFGGR
jgi:uncharacterized protein DUF4236